MQGLSTIVFPYFPFQLKLNYLASLWLISGYCSFLSHYLTSLGSEGRHVSFRIKFFPLTCLCRVIWLIANSTLSFHSLILLHKFVLALTKLILSFCTSLCMTHSINLLLLSINTANQSGTFLARLTFSLGNWRLHWHLRSSRLGLFARASCKQVCLPLIQLRKVSAFISLDRLTVEFEKRAWQDDDLITIFCCLLYRVALKHNVL